MKKKPTNKYYFSVEGQTERLYLEWLQKTINNTESARCKVAFDVDIEKDPRSYVKRTTVVFGAKVTHVLDFEGQEKEDILNFKKSLDLMKEAEKDKSVEYGLGYSNFTFELWMILHKMPCNAALYHRNEYLSNLNQAYGKHFASLREYKEETEYKNLLKCLSIEDVKHAIENAEAIAKTNEEDDGKTLQKHKGFEYYRENPSLSIHEVIRKILKDCKII